MLDFEKEKFDKENNFSVGQEVKNEPDYNRKNVDRIKKAIVGFFVFLCSLPLIICVSLVANLSAKDAGANTQTGTESTHIIMTEASLEEDTTQMLSSQILKEDGKDDVDKISKSDSDCLTNPIDETFEGANSNFNGKKVYLTFDDGPSTNTAEILDILNANGVKATFFVVHVDDQSLWPMYSRIVNEGHTLAMHSYTHVYNQIYESRDAFVEDVCNLRSFLYEQTGVTCDLYRFPGGSSNSVSTVDIQELMGYLDEEGITYFDWNALSGDAIYSGATPEQLDANIMGYVRANEGDSVVLMHDLEDRHETVEGLQSLIDTLKEEGYEIVPIDSETTPIQHISYDRERDNE